jgi:hypothetical protein
VQWGLNAAAESVSYVTVQDSDATAGVQINATNSFDALNNDNWVISEPPGTTIWNGSFDTDWTNTSNWSNGVPGAGDVASIPASADRFPVLTGATASFSTMTIAPGAAIDTGDQALNVTTLINSGIIYRTTAGTVPENATSGTVVYYGAGGGSAIAGQSYNNVYLAGGSGITYTLPADTTINGDLFLEDVTFFSSDANKERVFSGANLTQGSWIMSVGGDLRIGTGLSLDAGVAAGAGLSISGSATGSGTLTWNDTDIDVLGDLLVNTLTSPVASHVIEVHGDWFVSSFTPSATPTVELRGSGDIGEASFYNLRVYYSGSRTAVGNITVANELQIQPGATLSIGANDLTVNGGVSNEPTTFVYSGTLTAGTGTVVIQNGLQIETFVASSGVTLFDGSWNVVSFDPNGGQFRVDGATVIDQDNATFTTAGFPLSAVFDDLTIQSGASLDTNGNSLTINGAFTNQDTLIRHGGDYVSKIDTTQGTVEYQGAGGEIQVYAGTDYFDLNLNGDVTASTFTLGGDVTIANDLNLNTGTIDMGARRVQVAGGFLRNDQTNTDITYGTSTLEFYDASKTGRHRGRSWFHNVEITTPGKRVEFDPFISGSDEDQRMWVVSGGFLRIEGSAQNPVELDSSDGTNDFHIVVQDVDGDPAVVDPDPAAGYSVSNAIITNSNTNGIATEVPESPLLAQSSTDGGNNTGWTFSGSVYRWSATAGSSAWATVAKAEVAPGVLRPTFLEIRLTMTRSSSNRPPITRCSAATIICRILPLRMASWILAETPSL